MTQDPIFFTPAEQMRHIRETVNHLEADQPEAATAILAEHFSRLDTLREHIAVLEGNMLLHEEPFESNAPVIGPLIVRFRYIWNWMSTRWYVKPIMKQQNDFNTSATQTLRETLTTMEALAQSVQQMQIQMGHITSDKMDTSLSLIHI